MVRVTWGEGRVTEKVPNWKKTTADTQYAEPVNIQWLPRPTMEYGPDS